MHKNNYDSKSSIFSAQYKIPYDCSDSSRIVQHLEQSQQQLQFLKYKLTQTYQKLQTQIHNNMQIHSQNQNLIQKTKQMEQRLNLQQLENKKLKQVMESVLHNRKLLQQQLQYTHKRYKKVMSQKQNQFQEQKQKLSRNNQKLMKQVQFMQEQLENDQDKYAIQRYKIREKQYEHQINILQSQIRKLTSQKVTQVSRLKQQIQCYHRNTSPIKYFANGVNSRTTTNVDTETHKSNIIGEMSVIQSNIYESQNSEDSIGKWKKSSKCIDKPIILAHENNQNMTPNIKSHSTQKPKKSVELTDDQKLTKCQIQKKNVQNKLMRVQRQKRHTAEDRAAMEAFEKKLYELDSEISALKRRIRQKY